MPYRHLRCLKRLLEGNRCLSCNAQNGVAVHAVRGDLVFKYGIVQSQRLQRIASQLQTFRLIRRENIDAVLRGFRIHVSGCSQLFNAAHHSDTGEASHLAGLDRNSVLRKRAAVVTAGNSSAV